MGATYDSKSAQEDLISYFDRSVAAVQSCSDRLEHVYARPAIKICFSFYESNPFAFTFLAIFSALSLLPVLAFIGFSIFVFAFLFFVASSCGIIAIAVTETILTIILLSTLMALLLLASFLSISMISVYLVFRLVVLVREDGQNGIYEWANETKRHFINPSAGIATPRQAPEDSDTGSTVLVRAEHEVAAQETYQDEATEGAKKDSTSTIE